jgi:glucose-6-phosphate isomerase
MAPQKGSLTQRPTWQALREHYGKIRATHLRDLFAGDAKRGETFAIEDVGLYFDYSKHRITAETMRLLIGLAKEAGLRARIDAMFAGEKINVTEKRAVLHVALRAPRGESIMAETSCRRCMRCSTGWRISRGASATAHGRAIPAGRFAQ